MALERQQKKGGASVDATRQRIASELQEIDRLCAETASRHGDCSDVFKGVITAPRCNAPVVEIPARQAAGLHAATCVGASPPAMRREGELGTEPAPALHGAAPAS